MRIGRRRLQLARAERVGRWERSGLSAEKFARREGYKPKQQSFWRWKLRADGPWQPAPSSLTETPRFLPVHVVTVYRPTPARSRAASAVSGSTGARGSSGGSPLDEGIISSR
ncbi:IS66 family insertion sequence element accessory protein TnpA [Sorangium sp. So ce362]|uniref:IS66 family insertion sequence element accessory protein TnpA n=1 Tax=Sorangium sp. So ce362 TaxID=3133303 RepID=UPI003F6320D1